MEYGFGFFIFFKNRTNIQVPQCIILFKISFIRYIFGGFRYNNFVIYYFRFIMDKILIYDFFSVQAIN